MDDQIDINVLLARFKLLVRRQLDEAVDLDLLTNDPAYARRRLSEIEERAENEDLLVMLLRLRKRLLPVAPVEALPQGLPASRSAPARDYKFGARAW